MNKVFTLFEYDSKLEDDKLVGIITNEQTARQFVNYDKLGRIFHPITLDDTELLNRIAKESGKS